VANKSPRSNAILWPIRFPHAQPGGPSVEGVVCVHSFIHGNAKTANGDFTLFGFPVQIDAGRVTSIAVAIVFVFW
jgi:hypothetical protein